MRLFGFYLFQILSQRLKIYILELRYMDKCFYCPAAAKIFVGEANIAK